MEYRPMEINGKVFEELGEYIDRLLDDEKGCPWDKAQTLPDLPPQMHEEVDELAEAIRDGSAEKILDETGDVFLLAFLTLAKLRQAYGIDANGAARMCMDKIVRRHTWIFGDDADKVKTPEDAARLWKINKMKEKK